MYAGNPREAADQVSALEQAGLDGVWVAEAYGFDGPTLMGYLAAKTERLEIGSGILNIYSRTPAALLQTVAGLDNVSGGRAILGLGASGPQVIEGFHGVPYDKPLARTREIVDLVRRGLRRETLTSDGLYRLPLTREHGAATGLGKPLKILTRPERDRVPVFIAALDAQERRADRRDRRRLDAAPVPPRARAAGVGRRARGRPGQAVARPGAAAGQRRRHAARSERAPRPRSSSTWSGRSSRSTSAGWALGARTSTTTSHGRSATSARPRRSRTSTSTASTATRPPRCPPTGWRPPTWSARRRTSPSGSPPSARPASRTCRSRPVGEDPAALVAQVKEMVS